jgi:uncharacterized protein YeaC (DUF1315 family)
MSLDDLIANMTPDIYRNMKDAVELGRWGDGRTMTSEQKEFSIEAMMRYEHLNKIAEADRIGFVDTTNKRRQKAEAHAKAKANSLTDDDTQPIKIIE